MVDRRKRPDLRKSKKEKKTKPTAMERPADAKYCRDCWEEREERWEDYCYDCIEADLLDYDKPFSKMGRRKKKVIEKKKEDKLAYEKRKKAQNSRPR